MADPPRRDQSAIAIDWKFVERDFQIESIVMLCAEVSLGQRKLLVGMTNETGNTRTATAFIEPLFEAGFASRVLFVAEAEVPQIAKQSLRGADSAIGTGACAARKEAARGGLKHRVKRQRKSRCHRPERAE